MKGSISQTNYFLYFLLVLNVVFTFSVLFQLVKLREEITNAKETLKIAITVLDGLRVSVAGSVVEKAHLIKDGFGNLREGLKSVFN